MRPRLHRWWHIMVHLKWSVLLKKIYYTN